VTCEYCLSTKTVTANSNSGLGKHKLDCLCVGNSRHSRIKTTLVDCAGIIDVHFSTTYYSIDLPTCGKCKGSLSFPFWYYCIFCEGRFPRQLLYPSDDRRCCSLDHLFICNACDAEGVPDLERSSGKHTEEHHLIRCLESEKMDDKLSQQSND
jgi:hypothetical protein